MKPDAHKSKTTRQWKKKHGISTQINSTNSNVITQSQRQHEPIDNESSEIQQDEDTQYLKELSQLQLLPDDNSYFQFKQEKEQEKWISMDLSVLESRIMNLSPLELLHNTQESHVSSIVKGYLNLIPYKNKEKTHFISTKMDIKTETTTSRKVEKSITERENLEEWLDDILG